MTRQKDEPGAVTAGTVPAAKRAPHRPPRFKASVVEHALRESGGIYTVAARMLGCAPNTIANYVAKYPKLRKTCEEVEQITLDLAEAKLMRAINDSNMTAIIFYLKCKGKRRGYVERQELTGPNGAALTATLSPTQIGQMTDEQLDGALGAATTRAQGRANAARPAPDRGGEAPSP